MLRIGMTVVATMLLAGAAVAQQQPPAAPAPPDFSKVEIKTTDLGDNIYMLEGQGGNITVAVAKDGIIMVDGEYAPLHDRSRPLSLQSRTSRSNISSTPISTATTPAATNRLPGMASPLSPRSTSKSVSRPKPPTA